MADEKDDVNIRINTTADTSGAEKEVKAIDKVTEATKELTEADAERAKRKAEYDARMATPGYSSAGNPMAMPDSVMGPERTEQIDQETAALERQAEAAQELADAVEEASERIEEAGENSEAAGPKLDDVVGLQRAAGVQQFGEALGRAAGMVRNLANDLEGAGVKGAGLVSGLATGMESVSAGLQGAAAGFMAGGPLGAAIGGTIGLLTGPLNKAITSTVNDFKALKQAEDDAATAARNYKNAFDAANVEVRRNSLFEFFDRGKQAITDAIAEYQRFVQVRDATSEADTAVRKAQTSGDTSFRGAASNVQADFDSRIQKLENDIADARKSAELAEKAAVQAELNANSAKVSESTTQADVDQIRQEAQAAREAADKAQANADGAVLLAEQRLRTVIAEKDEQVRQTLADVGDEAAASGQRIIDLVNSASKQGETLTEAQKTAVTSLQQILLDGTVAQEEQVRFQTDLKTIITSLGNQGKAATEANALFGKAMETLDSNLKTYTEIIRNMQQRQQQIEADLKELREQAKNPPQPQ
jgi:DNA repair exonuclease SbcCD ATPase subunit